LSTLSNDKNSGLPVEVADLSFEAALAELERIVRQLEEGRVKLDDAIAAYERGTLLKRHCEKKLRDAQAKIEKITVGVDGAVQAEPMEQPGEARGASGAATDPPF